MNLGVNSSVGATIGSDLNAAIALASLI